MRRAVLVLCLVYAFCGTLGCFSSAPPSQLPQPPPIIVQHHVPVPVPAAIRRIAAELHTREDNTPTGMLVSRAAIALDVLSDVSDCVTYPPKIESAPAVNSTTAVVNPTTRPGPVARAKAWWEHALDVVGWCAIAVGIGIIALNIGQALLTPPWWTGLIREAKDMVFGVVFIVAGIICIAWPWPTTFVVGGLAVAYIAWRVGKAKTVVKPTT